jgi:hypothetical protein
VFLKLRTKVAAYALRLLLCSLDIGLFSREPVVKRIDLLLHTPEFQ